MITSNKETTARPYNALMDHIGAKLENTKRNIEIIGADLVSLHGFTQVPHFILTNKELSVGAKLYYWKKC